MTEKENERTVFGVMAHVKATKDVVTVKLIPDESPNSQVVVIMGRRDKVSGIYDLIENLGMAVSKALDDAADESEEMERSL